MSWKTNLLIGAAVLGLAVDVGDVLSVHNGEDYKKYQHQQQIQQGSDAVEMQNDRQRDKLPDGIDAENSRILTPSEVRPAEPKLPRLRLKP